MISCRLPKLILLSVGALAVGSCSYGYDIEFGAEDGRLVLNFDGGGLVGRRLPSVNMLVVESVGKVSRRIWKLESQASNGPQLRKVFYGQVPAGMKAKMAAGQLQIGQLYRVMIFATDGNGAGEFAISDDGEVVSSRD